MTSAKEARYPHTVLGTCCVPWRSEGKQLDEKLFRKSIAGLVERGMPDLYVFGTAGEGHSVTDEQYRQIVEVFVDEMQIAGGSPPMVGVINLSLSTVLERISFAAGLGVKTFQFCLPSWGTISDGEVRRVFEEVCGSFPELNFLHYNLMRTGRLIRPQEYGELAQEFPNLVATKYGAGDPETIEAVMRHAPQLRHFFTEHGYYLGAPLGKCGLLSSLSSSNPTRAWAYFKSGAEGDYATHAKLYRELAAMMGILRTAAGGLGWNDGAYDKIVSKVAEPNFPLYLLAPYRASTDAGFKDYFEALSKDFPEWLPQDISAN